MHYENLKKVTNTKELKKALDGEEPFIITNKFLSLRTNILKDALNSISPDDKKHVAKDDEGKEFFIISGILKFLKTVLTKLLSAAMIILIIYLGGYALFSLANKFEYLVDVDTEIEIPGRGRVKCRVYKPKAE